MCTILFSWQERPDYPLVLIANRDEFYERPTSVANWWDDHPDVLGGRDLQAGGTWMGVNKNGKFAALTNFRKWPLTGQYSTSRGDLVRNFLTTDVEPESFNEVLKETGESYEGFNLLFGNGSTLMHYSNRGASGGLLIPSLYGLSNHLLDTPWPKVKNGKAVLRHSLSNGQLPDSETFFNILENREEAPEKDLPDTGIGLEKEKLLSALFVNMPGYGTRVSTIITIDHQSHVNFIERSHDLKQDQQFQFRIQHEHV